MLEEESKADEVTLEDARNYYDARPDLFESETLITASHILKKAESENEMVQAEQKIIEIKKLLDNGEDFLNLIKKESDDGVNDGHLGTFEKGRMVPSFEKAAFALKPGEISNPRKLNLVGILFYSMKEKIHR